MSEFVDVSVGKPTYHQEWIDYYQTIVEKYPEGYTTPVLTPKQRSAFYRLLGNRFKITKLEVEGVVTKSLYRRTCCSYGRDHSISIDWSKPEVSECRSCTACTGDVMVDLFEAVKEGIVERTPVDFEQRRLRIERR